MKYVIDSNYSISVPVVFSVLKLHLFGAYRACKKCYPVHLKTLYIL